MVILTFGRPLLAALADLLVVRKRSAAFDFPFPIAIDEGEHCRADRRLWRRRAQQPWFVGVVALVESNHPDRLVLEGRLLNAVDGDLATDGSSLAGLDDVDVAWPIRALAVDR